MKWGLGDTQLESLEERDTQHTAPNPGQGETVAAHLPAGQIDSFLPSLRQTHSGFQKDRHIDRYSEGQEDPESPLFGDRQKSKKTDTKKSSTQTEHTYTHTRTHLFLPQRQSRDSQRGTETTFLSPLPSFPLSTLPRLLASSDLLNQQGEIQFVPVCTRPSPSPSKQCLISRE